MSRYSTPVGHFLTDCFPSPTCHFTESACRKKRSGGASPLFVILSICSRYWDKNVYTGINYVFALFRNRVLSILQKLLHLCSIRENSGGKKKQLLPKICFHTINLAITSFSDNEQEPFYISQNYQLALPLPKTWLADLGYKEVAFCNCPSQASEVKTLPPGSFRWALSCYWFQTGTLVSIFLILNS